jgi:hypothetical protein
MKSKFAVMLVLIFSSAVTAMAQRQEVGLLLGGVSASDHEISSPPGGSVQISTGLTYYANYAVRLADLKVASVHFEVPFAATPSIDISSRTVTVPRNYAALFITPGLRVKFLPSAHLSPYFALGGGYGRFDESNFRVDNQPNTGRRGTNSGVFDFGGGIDVRVLSWLSLRGEVRDFYTDKPNFNESVSRSRQHNVLSAGGIVLRF